MKYQEIKNSKYLKIQDLKGEENYLEGTFESVEQLEHSPAYFIRKKNGRLQGVMGSTDLTAKMEEVPIGKWVKIGLLNEVPTKHKNPCYIAYVAVGEEENVSPTNNNETL